MEVVEKSSERIVLRIESGYNLANAIRRSVEEIPTLAIDDVEIFKNDSAIYDEFLAHRLGLIPVKTDGKMGKSTEIDFKLKKSGPGIVYSGDIQGGAKIVHDKIPITLLEKGQELEFVATAKMGTGIDHTKHVPGLCYYRYLVEVKSDPKTDKIIEGSKGAIKPEKKGSKWICDLNETVVDEIQGISKDAINDSEEILLFIESFGHLDAETILTKAIQVLGENLSEFEKALKP